LPPCDHHRLILAVAASQRPATFSEPGLHILATMF
jgi:hypothetical protein